jgi:hypothetical protein
LYTDSSIFGAALTQLLSSNGTHTLDETRATSNEGVSIVSAPKNVKFLIPLGRSGINSNESTFGLIESTTRTVTHVRDIFPANPVASSTNTIEPPIESIDQANHQEMVISNSEEIPLLENVDQTNSSA